MWRAWAAGVLPVSMWHGTPVVLLGRDAPDKGGKWSDFAGGGEAVDATPRHTAVRELAEETGGLLTLPADALDAALEFRDTTPSGKVLHRYVARVAYDPFAPSRFRGAKDDEKVALRWFPLAALPPMRRVFAVQMRRDGPAIERFARGGHQIVSQAGPTGHDLSIGPQLS